MSDTYDRAKALAARQLAPRSKGGKGLECDVAAITQGEYDTDLGGYPVTTVVHNGSAMREEYSSGSIDGTNIRVGDFKLLLSPVKLDGSDMPEPKTDDTVTFNGQTAAVVRVKPWNYAGLACGFEVQVRK